MPFLRVVIWVMFFMVATFCWVVVFEHGLRGFAPGCAVEWREFRRFLGAAESPPPE